MILRKKATRIRLADFSSAPMRAFHLSWLAFFLCFFGWFGIAPLMAVVRDADPWIAVTEGIYGVHQAIVRATRNRFLMQVFDAVVADRRAVQYDGRSNLNGPVGAIVREQTLRELTAIVDALEARDAKGATALADAYFTRILASLSVYG